LTHQKRRLWWRLLFASLLSQPHPRLILEAHSEALACFEELDGSDHEAFTASAATVDAALEEITNTRRPRSPACGPSSNTSWSSTGTGTTCRPCCDRRSCGRRCWRVERFMRGSDKFWKSSLGRRSTGTIPMIKSLVVAAALTIGLAGYAFAQDTVTGAPAGTAPMTPAPGTHPPIPGMTGSHKSQMRHRSSMSRERARASAHHMHHMRAKAAATPAT
jgi:hypothetical protein